VRYLKLIPAKAPRLVSPKQLAEWFGVCHDTIHRWAAKGLLPQPLRLTPRTIRFETDRVRGALARIAAAAEALGLTEQPAAQREEGLSSSPPPLLREPVLTR
jgi:predicted DNA-binding transcriptional regulator AlpA